MLPRCSVRTRTRRRRLRAPRPGSSSSDRTTGDVRRWPVGALKDQSHGPYPDRSARHKVRVDVTGRYEPHELFQAPGDPDVTLWRYLDFTKLVALLDTRSLFFARTDTLEDAFEGSYSRLNVVLRPEVYKDGNFSPEVFAQWGGTTRAFRRWIFVNCWNMSARESAALWGAIRFTRRGCGNPVNVPSTYRVVWFK